LMTKLVIDQLRTEMILFPQQLWLLL